jgi:hypothetical protein
LLAGKLSYDYFSKRTERKRIEEAMRRRRLAQESQVPLLLTSSE